jgi:hypothetical protein
LYKKRVLWSFVALLTISALWALSVEITYERNIRHMPASFHQHRHAGARLWKT